MSAPTMRAVPSVAAVTPRNGRPDPSPCVTDRCGARRPGWLCVLDEPALDLAQPHCHAGHRMVRRPIMMPAMSHGAA